MHPERLAHLEAIIAARHRDFFELGRALSEIKQDRLYRLALYESFEAYVKARWDMGRSQAYRLIEAYQVVSNLSPIGDILPANESQTRPLARLAPLEQRAAWKRFLSTGNDLTASNIKAAAHATKASHRNEPADLSNRITEAYMAAVRVMLEQVRAAQNDQWRKTSRQAALLWNRMVRERILAKVKDNG